MKYAVASEAEGTRSDVPATSSVCCGVLYDSNISIPSIHIASTFQMHLK